MSSTSPTSSQDGHGDAHDDNAREGMGKWPELAPADENTMRILIATDNHVGFKEKDPVRGDDSIETLDEIFRIGKHYNADMVVFGGDLFHDNKPSRRTLHRVLSTFRKHVLGGGPVGIQVVSDQHVNFRHSQQEHVNYEDPNLAVELPVFIIHGNHDDPTREGGLNSLSAVDMLSVAGLANYFGKTDKLDEIAVEPILIAKGHARLALYGLGWVRDERLNRLLAAQKVKFVRPCEDTDSWFNLFMVHQNRDSKGRGAKNCMNEAAIPDFMHLVSFGHEHESIPNATQAVDRKFCCTQPGSSIATSLVEGEAEPKHVAILDMRYEAESEYPCYRLTPIPLQTVRPFFMHHVELSTVSELDVEAALNEKEAQVEEYLTGVVQKVIDEAAREHAAKNPPGTPTGASAAAHDRLSLPLVRVRVEHTGFPTLNSQRFGGKFVHKVANPGELLQFHRKKNTAPRRQKNGAEDGMMDTGDDGDRPDDPNNPANKQMQIRDLIGSTLKAAQDGMQVLDSQAFTNAVEEYVVKESALAIEDFVEAALKAMQRKLTKEHDINTDNDLHRHLGIDVEADRLVPHIDDDDDDSGGKAKYKAKRKTTTKAKPKARAKGKPKAKAKSKRGAAGSDSDSDFGVEEEDEEEDEQLLSDGAAASVASSVRSRRSAASKKKKKTTAATGRRAGKGVELIKDDDDDDDEDEKMSVRSSSSRRKTGPTAVASRRKTTKAAKAPSRAANQFFSAAPSQQSKQHQQQQPRQMMVIEESSSEDDESNRGGGRGNDNSTRSSITQARFRSRR